MITSTIQYHSSNPGVGYLIDHHDDVGVPKMSLQLSENVTGLNLSVRLMIHIQFTNTPYDPKSDIFRVMWYL